MKDQNTRIAEIRKKISGLMQQYSSLKTENDSLSHDNQILKEELAELHKKFEEIQNKDINLHLSRALEDGGTGEVSGIRQKLDEYIREIDTVIAFLKD